MKRRFLVVLGIVALGACATEGAKPGETPPETAPEGNEAVAGDTGDGSTEDPADARAPLCSSAGWCTTRLPEQSLVFNDIWPLEKKAFAVGLSYGVIGKILEYDGEQWRFLGPLFGARAVWAPSENEVWAGGDAGNGGLPAVKRGVRASAADPWSWSGWLEGEAKVNGLWGSGPNDVYVLAGSNRVYHGGGASAPELVLDPEGGNAGGLKLDRILGTSANDVWVIGRRRYCGYLAHKSNGAFVPLADAKPVFDPEAGTPICAPIGGAAAWYAPDFESPYQRPLPAFASAPGEIEIVLSDRIQRVRLASEGTFTVATGARLHFGELEFPELRSIWGPTPEDVLAVGLGVVMRTSASFDADAGVFSISSVALNGSALRGQFSTVRGTAQNNLWVVGESYALHKTTP